MVNDHKHTNALINETSPYLLQHAHNPVDWYPWGDEALGRARKENKPILLSIGYSACHWCHVMEHESFENEDIAQLMNENFINIKVDREERPDLDQIYMMAVQMMTGQGGWPMTMFLTPAGVPFYGGTYFPPQDRYNIPGFPRILMSVAAAYRSQPEQVESTVTAMLGELRRVGLAEESRELLTTEILDSAYRRIARNFDPANGGFGGAPKFPPSMTLEFFLHTYYRTASDEALAMVRHTAKQMAAGGMYDQLGGGFHRYSVDAKWLVPHFEKMLYDNAQLARLYLHLYQITGDEFARRVVAETLDYVVREMTDARGGFYSSQDADSEGQEGKFFVWSKQEIVEILGAPKAGTFCDYYGVTDEGNFEEKNILNISASIDEVARKHQTTTVEARQAIDAGRQQLFESRERRIKPGRDEKVLTAWNGLMLTAFAEASAVLTRADYLKVAQANADFLLSELQRDGLVLRTWKNGQAKLNGYLEDYASLIDGLTTLYEVTGQLKWLENAIRLTDRMIEQFWDDEAGGFFFTGKAHEQLILRSKEWLDNATPSGNSLATQGLLRLAALTGNDDYRRRATTVLRLMAAQMQRFPSAFGLALTALDFHLAAPLEIALVGSASDPRLTELRQQLWRSYLPNRVIALCTDSYESAVKVVPLLSGRNALQTQPTAYVCQHQTCRAPALSAAELGREISAAMPGTTPSTTASR
jgi:uncharacterized protein YyaL (SSP411 family)